MKIRSIVLTFVIITTLIFVACAGGEQFEKTPTILQTAPGTPTITPTITPALTITPTVTTIPQPPTDLSYLIGSDPATVDNSTFPVTEIDALHLTSTGKIPVVNIEDYRLTVDGLVQEPLTLTYDEILAYPSTTQVVLLICPLVFFDNAQWTGVPVSTLLTEAGIKAGATTITFESLDGFKNSLPLDVVQKDGVFLAYKVDGQILPAAHGYPLRLVAKGVYGNHWVKWVNHIEVT